MSKQRTAEKFAEAIKRAFKNVGQQHWWPAEAAQIQAYSNTFFAVWFFKKYKENTKKFGKGLETLRVNHLYTLLYDVIILGLKIAKTFEHYPITQKEIINFVAFISNIARKKIQNDLFCLKGTNRILSKKEVSNIIKNTKWIESSPARSKEISQLSVAAISLDWALYFDLYAIGGMIVHGPYRCKEGILIIKEWFDLNPPIWKLRNKYPRLTMCLIYKPVKDLCFDIMNHFVTKENMNEKLIKFSIRTDNKILSIEAIKKLSSYYYRLTAKQTKYVNKLKPIDVIKKGTEIGYYIYKNFLNYYKVDWHPPKEVYQNIKRQGLKYWNRYRFKPSSDKEFSQVAKIFDPRISFIR